MSDLSDLVTNLSSIYDEVHNLIVPGNLKAGVTAFNVTGTVVELAGETKTITPTAATQVITPSQGKNGITEVTVNGDANLLAENIKSGVTIFGVTGTYDGESNNQSE